MEEESRNGLENLRNTVTESMSVSLSCTYSCSTIDLMDPNIRYRCEAFPFLHCQSHLLARIRTLTEIFFFFVESLKKSGGWLVIIHRQNEQFQREDLEEMNDDKTRGADLGKKDPPRTAGCDPTPSQSNESPFLSSFGDRPNDQSC